MVDLSTCYTKCKVKYNLIFGELSAWCIVDHETLIFFLLLFLLN